MTFWLATAGALVGCVCLVSQWVRDHLRFISDLLGSMRPLAIPFLVLVASFTVNLPWWAQFLAALLMVLFAGAIVRRDLDRAGPVLALWWKELEGDAKAVAKGLAKLGFKPGLALVVAAVALNAMFDQPGQDGLAGVALLASLITFFVALGLRLFAYATSRFRVVVSVVGGAGALTLLMFGGLLPGWQRGRWFPVVVGVVAILAIVLSLTKWEPQETDGPNRWFAAGLIAAVASGLLLMGATALSLLAIDHQGGRDLRESRGLPATLYADSADTRLEYRYAPVLAFNREQKWTPSDADAYLAGAEVLRTDNTVVTSGRYACPPPGPRSCLHMSIDCPAAAGACSHALPPHTGSAPVSDGVIYVRTLHSPLPELSRPVTRTAAETRTLLQYWMFYRYDEWSNKTLGARLIQRHEGDWESVSVGLDDQDRPLFVAYSAHCGGTWKAWDDTAHRGDHPLVAVARGSQANYPDTGAVRPPDFTSCARIPRGVGTLAAFAANVRDVTGDDWEWGAAQVESVDETHLPMSFPGYWGGNSGTEFHNERDFPEHPRPGVGPPSPPLQPPWEKPFATIFCGRYWSGPQACDKNKL